MSDVAYMLVSDLAKLTGKDRSHILRMCQRGDLEAKRISEMSAELALACGSSSFGDSWAIRRPGAVVFLGPRISGGIRRKVRLILFEDGGKSRTVSSKDVGGLDDLLKSVPGSNWSTGLKRTLIDRLPGLLGLRTNGDPIYVFRENPPLKRG